MSRRQTRSRQFVTAECSPDKRRGCRDDRSRDAREQLRIPGWKRGDRCAKREAAFPMINQLLIAAIAAAVLSGTVEAQIVAKPAAPLLQDNSTAGAIAGCPGGNGIHITTTSGPVTESSSGVNTVIGLNQSVDTTMVFDISRKTWTRTNFAAALSLGLADESRGRYAICAGVTALMPTATLTISGARGRVHFAASLAQLNNALRANGLGQ